MEAGLKKQAALRLKVAAGHLESVRRMVDQDVYCVNIMRQVAAVQASLEEVQRILLRNHLLTCVADAMRQGLGQEIVDELMDAMKYMPFNAGEAIAPDAPLHSLVHEPVCACHRPAPPADGLAPDPGTGREQP
ncbi:MAG: metal-sensitive transcriptional regulator [Firmicutes bacterium]|nr:metal-sensitive transcriptional regulator [Bacillota bacterium]